MTVNDFKDIPCYSNAKRAIEVAIVSKAVLTIFGRSWWGLESLDLSASRISPNDAEIITRIPRHDSDPRKLIDDIVLYPKLSMAILVGEQNATDILSVMDKKLESSRDVAKRIEEAIANKKNVSFKLTNTMQDLITNAYNKLNLHAGSIFSIKHLSIAIAAIDGCKEVEIHHIAEAIQYLPEMITIDDLDLLKQRI